MPKIIYGVKERKKENLKSWIYGQMKVKKYSSEDMAERLGIHRNTFRNKMNNMTLDYGELLTIFKLLEADPDVVKEKMTL